jgi:hypothetical protein
MFTKYAGSGHVPPIWYGLVEYRIASGRQVTPTATFSLPAEFVHDDRVAVAMPDPPGDYETNIVASPFVGAGGAAVDVGYSPNVLLVVHRSGTEPKDALLTAAPKIPTAQRIGVAVSGVSVVSMIALCAVTGWLARRRRRMRSA